jgi:NADH-quinone oxidoreductase subunit L
LFLIIIGLLTIFFSSFLSLFEFDFKKIVAFRTLSQLGFCFFSFSLGLSFFCSIHLIRHAIFKRLLFIQVGFIIFYNLGKQDFRFFFMLRGDFYLVLIQFFLSLMNLCGLFFFSGIMSKDLIFEIILNFNLGFFFYVFFF